MTNELIHALETKPLFKIRREHTDAELFEAYMTALRVVHAVPQVLNAAQRRHLHKHVAACGYDMNSEWR
jgi:hypothetical protein